MKAMVVAMAFFSPLIAMGDDDRVDKVLSYLRGNWKSADYSVVTPDIRDEVIARLRKDGGGPFQEINGAGYNEYRLLIRLGDKDTTKQIVETTRSRWLTGKGWAFQDVLADSAQPAVIPLIAEDFFRNDGDKLIPAVFEGDIAYTKRPFSIEMCRVAFGVVAASEAFTPEARKWAKESLERSEYVPPPLTREVVQQWWRENGGHFRAGDYQAVQPGKALPAPPQPPTEAEPAPTLAAATPALPISTPTPVSSAPVIAAAESPTPSSGLLWTVAAVVVALLSGLLFVWKRRA